MVVATMIKYGSFFYSAASFVAPFAAAAAFAAAGVVGGTWFVPDADAVAAVAVFVILAVIPDG